MQNLSDHIEQRARVVMMELRDLSGLCKQLAAGEMDDLAERLAGDLAWTERVLREHGHIDAAPVEKKSDPT